MKIFFGSTFIEKEKLKEAGINYPIKLEYYKIINEDEIIKKQNVKFGIDIIKTKYLGNSIKTDNKMIKYVSNDENKIEEILNIFKENAVTPINALEVISDFSKNKVYI